MQLSYRAATPETSAICATFEYAKAEYEVVEDAEACEATLIVDGTTITGWLPIFVFASRMAHTLPGDRLEMAMVMEAIAKIDGASLAQVEALFAHGKPWLVSELEESTAADFLLIARLRRMRDDGHSLRTYPLLLAYSDRNPAFAEKYYESAPTSCLVS